MFIGVSASTGGPERRLLIMRALTAARYSVFHGAVIEMEEIMESRIAKSETIKHISENHQEQLSSTQHQENPEKTSKQFSRTDTHPRQPRKHTAV